MIYFTSDTHFFYRKSPCRVGRRLFGSYEEKNAFLEERWNQRVAPKDDIYILGDFSDGGAGDTNALLDQLNGRKYLVIGNNDRYLEDASFDSSVFVWCRHYYELHELGTKFVLFHFPIEAWSGYLKDRVHLHGHLHRLQPVHESIRRYEVGVDAHDGFPVSIDEVWSRIEPMHNASRRMPGMGHHKDQAGRPPANRLTPDTAASITIP